MTGRIKKSRSELQAALSEQIELLSEYSAAFDQGKTSMAKPMSTSLRVLLHETKRQRSLLEQLQLRSGLRYIDTAGPISASNLAPQSLLVSMRFDTGDVSFVPRCISGFVPEAGFKKTVFSDWWGHPVVRIPKVKDFSRRDLVLSVADTDGGAHVDAGLESEYFSLSRANALGWVFSINGGDPTPMPNPVPACMRQIAHEVIETLASSTAMMKG
ncbi:hypothetical protein [Pseudoxanthomonas sp. SE1]|uniref:hypothetical protein n=1 Tax=Pseudoxanthomonas sp. SE1 TaxID=1664560 RepID=UPI00240D6B13|nr:hypothetical protein [Pseudoxanthomonas sp. SE1]WFC42562.1 hypothetical protein OY559_03275 [Pseudoxanthomonas sp. SE1]